MRPLRRFPMSIAWEPDRCHECTAVDGHYEHCSLFYPEYERDGLYRLTKACPTCSIGESRPCANCHHPRGVHIDRTGLCDHFIACGCLDYAPIKCQFGCRDGRIVPDRVKHIIRWHLGLASTSPDIPDASRPILDSEIEDVVFALDEEAAVDYPAWPEGVVHRDHVHIEMKVEDA